MTAPSVREALEMCVASLERANTTEGCCCCGSSMEAHGLGSGHAPVDMGDYYAGLALEAARAALAAPPSEIPLSAEVVGALEDCLTMMCRHTWLKRDAEKHRNAADVLHRAKAAPKSAVSDPPPAGRVRGYLGSTVDGGIDDHDEPRDPPAKERERMPAADAEVAGLVKEMRDAVRYVDNRVAERLLAKGADMIANFYMGPGEEVLLLQQRLAELTDTLAERDRDAAREWNKAITAAMQACLVPMRQGDGEVVSVYQFTARDCYEAIAALRAKDK